MTALLTADEAARLRPGEQLVIVRAGDRGSIEVVPVVSDPLPVPGRDWGIVIDCVEVAP